MALINRGPGMICRVVMPIIIYATMLVSPAAALPPPVDVAPVLVVPAAHSSYADRATRLFSMLARDNWIALRAAALSAAQVEHCSSLEDPFKCASAILAVRADAESTVAVFVDHPGWQSAAIRMRCVGPDALKAREVRVHLDDALVESGRIAAEERRHAASCLIGALHGGVRD